MIDALVRALESFFIQRYRILPYLASFRGLRMRPTARYEAKSENSSLSPHLSAPPALHMLPHICEDVFHWLIVVSLPTSLYLLPLYLHFSSSWRFMRHVGVLRGKRHPELNARLSVRRKFCLRVARCTCMLRSRAVPACPPTPTRPVGWCLVGAQPTTQQLYYVARLIVGARTRH